MSRNNIEFPHLSKIKDSELDAEMHYAGTQVFNGLENMKWRFNQFRINKTPIGHRKLCGDVVERFDYYMAIVAEKEFRKIP